MQLSIIVPTFNEAPNVAELVRRVTAETQGDRRGDRLRRRQHGLARPMWSGEVAAIGGVPVRLIHREERTGGLGGAVMEGFAAAAADACLVMDGDLQHPPEEIRGICTSGSCAGMSMSWSPRATAARARSAGLADRTRVMVSKVSTALTRAMFPIRLKDVSDPMTGFFLIDRRAVDAATLRPRGFKILLEILARKNLRIAEVPFDFADRHAGESKASMRQGLHFLTQLTALRFGKMSLFAVIGGLGAVANIAIVWALTQRRRATTSSRRSSPPR